HVGMGFGIAHGLVVVGDLRGIAETVGPTPARTRVAPQQFRQLWAVWRAVCGHGAPVGPPNPRRAPAMIIVSGRLYVRPERRDAFLAASSEAVKQARRTAGC